MSIAVAIPPARPIPPVRWTVDEFHEIASLPHFECRRLILVDGEILDTPPANHPHDMGIGACQEALSKVFAGDYWVRVQMALPMGSSTDPVPDIAVVSGARHTHVRQPSTALLVVEVSDMSLAYDLGEKANLCAAGKIADYWVLDVSSRQLTVFRDPVPDPSEPFGFKYAAPATFGTTASVSALAAHATSIRVADLFS
jgi:Uma2 family endonuclease